MATICQKSSVWPDVYVQSSFPQWQQSCNSAAQLKSLGSCFSCGLAAMVWLQKLLNLNPPSSLISRFSQPTHVSPSWGHSRRTAGVTGCQTALNGPRQTVQINNRLEFSHGAAQCEMSTASPQQKAAREQPAISDKEQSLHLAVSSLFDSGWSAAQVPLWEHLVWSSSAESAVSVAAVQPHRQDRLYSRGGHTGRPVSVLEALRRAVIGHWQLVLLGGQVLSTATERPDQDGHRQEKEGASSGHYVIPVDGQGRHWNASPWWRDTEQLASEKQRGVALFLNYFLILLCHSSSRLMSMHKHAGCKNKTILHEPKK